MADEMTLPPAPAARKRDAKRAETAGADEKIVETRERPTRAETTRRERRRRENVDRVSELKLGITFEMDPAFEYRWVNEGIDGQRLHRLTVEDDWEAVSKEGVASDGVGSALRRAVGESKSGPIYAYLCRKPKDWYETDHRKRQQRDDKLMSYIKEGRPPTAPEKGLKQSDHVYGDGVRISEGLGRG